ncbi:unnamed protein product [Durusdinium trenchii]|uniref:Uncharacterized protein n=1 Tax=Durusdinium trenchii TaxID=1381693 RepID=A0ABP0PEC1_9DINO
MATRFRVGSAKAKAAAGPTVPEAGEVSIATIASGQMPLTPVSCRGRIHTIFGTQERYPVCKFIMSDKPGPDGAEPVSIVVKLSAAPGQRLELDSMVLVLNAEVRALWKRPDGSIPEEWFCDRLAPRELGCNMAEQGKRKRGVLSTIRLLREDPSYDVYPKAAFDVLPSMPTALPSEPDVQMANVQVRVVDVGDVSGGDRAKKMIRVADAAAEDDSVESLYDIALYDGHATAEMIRAETTIAIIGLSLVRGGYAYVGTPPQLCLAMEEEKLSTDFQKLGVRVDKSEEPGEQHAGHSTGDDGAASEATAMHSFNYMLDLNVPGHFATQASARRFLQSVMCLGCHEVRACVRPLRWTMAIPLKEGLQIRCAFQGTAEQGKQLLEKIRAVGRLRELNEGDAQRQKQDVVGGLVVRWAEEGGDMRRQAYRARQQLVDNVASLKRSNDAAVHLAQLLPPGGRAAKMRRAVSHLGEVLVIGALLAEQQQDLCCKVEAQSINAASCSFAGAHFETKPKLSAIVGVRGSRVTAATVRSASQSVADNVPAEEEAMVGKSERWRKFGSGV